MIHGAGQSAGLWRAQVEGLAASADPLALDLPGHGSNHTEKGEASIAAYAGKVLDAVADSSLKRVVLCGHSMGGAVVQYLLLHYPRSFKAGILVNTGARLRVRPDFLDRIGRDYTQFVDYIYQQSIAVDNQKGSLLQRFRLVSECPSDVALGDYLACDAFDALHQIGRIQVPVLVVGSQQDHLTPVKYSTYLADRIPGARLSILPATGHYAPLENPTALNRLIVQFIEVLEGKRADEAADTTGAPDGSLRKTL